MFDGIEAWLNSPAPILDLLLLGSTIAWAAWRFEKRVAKIEAEKDKTDMDARWAKKDDEPHEYGQVYSHSVYREWERRHGEAKIAKLAHDWGFRALGRDRPYTVPAGKHAVFVRTAAWFAVLHDGAVSRDILSPKQRSDLHQATAWHDDAAIIGPIRASEQVDWPDDWYHQEPEDWKFQKEEKDAAKRVAEHARDWGFPFLNGGDNWRAMPSGGTLFETNLVPVSDEQARKLDSIPAADRLIGFIAAAPSEETVKRKRR